MEKNKCEHCHHEKSDGNGFMAGVVMGLFVGGLAGYIYGAPDGKKRAKELMQKGEDLADTLQDKFAEAKTVVEEKVAEQMQDESSKPKKKASFTSNLKKRFFKKRGRKLS